jgi:hypothetical protein
VKHDEKFPGAVYARETDRGYIVVYRMIYTTRVCIGADEFGYSRAWCYPDHDRALVAAEQWNGEGDPPDGWIKEVGTERRRVNGDPNREYDASKNPLAENV